MDENIFYSYRSTQRQEMESEILTQDNYTPRVTCYAVCLWEKKIFWNVIPIQTHIVNQKFYEGGA